MHRLELRFPPLVLVAIFAAAIVAASVWMPLVHRAALDLSSGAAGGHPGPIFMKEIRPISHRGMVTQSL